MYCGPSEGLKALHVAPGYSGRRSSPSQRRWLACIRPVFFRLSIADQTGSKPTTERASIMGLFTPCCEGPVPSALVAILFIWVSLCWGVLLFRTPVDLGRVSESRVCKQTMCRWVPLIVLPYPERKHTLPILLRRPLPIILASGFLKAGEAQVA